MNAKRLTGRPWRVHRLIKMPSVTFFCFVTARGPPNQQKTFRLPWTSSVSLLVVQSYVACSMKGIFSTEGNIIPGYSKSTRIVDKYMSPLDTRSTIQPDRNEKKTGAGTIVTLKDCKLIARKGSSGIFLHSSHKQQGFLMFWCVWISREIAQSCPFLPSSTYFETRRCTYWSKTSGQSRQTYRKDINHHPKRHVWPHRAITDSISYTNREETGNNNDIYDTVSITNAAVHWKLKESKEDQIYRRKLPEMMEDYHPERN